jgi:Na+-translocating ferredoxin:NAD+ oxidoreductase RnfE subunit
MQSSCNCIYMLCYIQTHRHTGTSSYENIIKHKSCHTSCHACHTSAFFIFWCWGRGAFIPIGLILAMIAMCHGTRTHRLVSNAVGLYTHWSYTCFAKISFNLGLTFNVNDFVLCSCSLYLILIMIMLSYTCIVTLYASLSLFKYIMKT